MSESSLSIILSYLWALNQNNILKVLDVIDVLLYFFYHDSQSALCWTFTGALSWYFLAERPRCYGHCTRWRAVGPDHRRWMEDENSLIIILSKSRRRFNKGEQEVGVFCGIGCAYNHIRYLHLNSTRTRNIVWVHRWYAQLLSLLLNKFQHLLLKNE